VGKSSALMTYVNNEFPVYIPALANSFENIIMDGTLPVRLVMSEAPAHAHFDQLRHFALRFADVFIVCFSPNDATSFNNITEKWIPEIAEVHARATVIVACLKNDLRENRQDNGGGAWIDEDIASELVGLKTEGVTIKGYYECSALENTGLDDLFLNAYRVIK